MLGDYLDFQAAVGITKHTGGLAAAKELLALSRVREAREVLEVGCGIGVGPVLIARTSPACVVAVDISPRMVEWARRRAREAGLADRIDVRIADACDLPFESDRFDVVICESVLGFVGEKARAVRELVRVTKPGGRVGINESLWVDALPPDVAATVPRLGVEVLDADEWRLALEREGLRDVTVRVRRIEPGVEVRSRLRWIGLRWTVLGWLRTVRLLLRPETRATVRTMFGGGARLLPHTGYGLFVGVKPPRAARRRPRREASGRRDQPPG